MWPKHADISLRAAATIQGAQREKKSNEGTLSLTIKLLFNK